MIDSIILLIGNLILPYLVLSIFAMLLVELIAQVSRLRAKTLEQSIRGMLADPAGGVGFATAVYNHPLIQSLSPGRRKPSYIPGPLFAVALVDEIEREAGTDDFEAAVKHMANKELGRSLETLLHQNSRGSKVQIIEEWFRDVMEQGSGLYRWRTLVILTFVATALVVSLNFDAIRISNHIAERDMNAKILEAEVGALAKRESQASNNSAAPTSPEIEINSLRAQVITIFPIGWPAEMQSFKGALKNEREFLNWVPLKIVGLLTSILAVMLGAPFLFDILNKFILVRLTVKPHEAVSYDDDAATDE